MFKTFADKIGEFKKETIMTPLFMVMEVLMECIIPVTMAALIDHMQTGNISVVVYYGSILIVLAFLSLFAGICRIYGRKADRSGLQNRGGRDDLPRRAERIPGRELSAAGNADPGTRRENHHIYGARRRGQPTDLHVRAV